MMKLRSLLILHARSQQSAVSFDDQLIGRTSILLLWNTYIKATKEQAREQEKAKRLEDIRMKKVKSDTASVKSSSTAKTVSTAVGSEAPNAVKLVDIADGKIASCSFLSLIQTFSAMMVITAGGIIGKYPE